MKIIITGGHLSPALATISELKKANCQILYVGRKHTAEGDKAESIEYQMVSQEHIEYQTIPAGRIQRKFTKYTIPSLFKIPLGFIKAVMVINNFRPDVILTFGGYVGFPFAVAGFLLRVPVVIHEQTLSPGLANRVALRFANKIAISFPETAKNFPGNKTVFTGLPLRKEVFTVNQDSKYESLKSQNCPVIYITGGNQGAHTINNLVEQILDSLLEKYTIIHQTGNSLTYNDFGRLKKKETEHYFVEQFIGSKDIGTVFAVSDFLISRSGANTVSELLALNKPAILIPIPWTANNEQGKNAEMLKENNLAKVLSQDSLTPGILLSEIEDFSKNLDKYSSKNVGNNYQDAGNKLVEIVYETANTKKS